MVVYCSRRRGKWIVIRALQTEVVLKVDTDDASFVDFTVGMKAPSIQSITPHFQTHLQSGDENWPPRLHDLAPRFSQFARFEICG
jgi:ketosteroid isomerase-like protein